MFRALYKTWANLIYTDTEHIVAVKDETKVLQWQESLLHRIFKGFNLYTSLLILRDVALTQEWFC